MATSKGKDVGTRVVHRRYVPYSDAHYAGEAGPPLLHRHKACGCDFAPVLSCSECGDAVGARDVDVRVGPGSA